MHLPNETEATEAQGFHENSRNQQGEEEFPSTNILDAASETLKSIKETPVYTGENASGSKERQVEGKGKFEHLDARLGQQTRQEDAEKKARTSVDEPKPASPIAQLHKSVQNIARKMASSRSKAKYEKKNGEEQMLIAVKDHKPYAVNKLIKDKVSVNTRTHGSFETTILHVAVEAKYNDIVRLLVGLNEEGKFVSDRKEKVNVHALDGEGRSPLHVATEVGNINAIKMLMKAKANISLKDGNGWTPLHRAPQNVNSGILIELLRMEKRPQDVLELLSLKDSTGKTILHRAAITGNTGTLNRIMDIIKDPCKILHIPPNNPGRSGEIQTGELKKYLNIEDKRKRTALYYMAENGLETIKDRLRPDKHSKGMQKKKRTKTINRMLFDGIEIKPIDLNVAAKNGHLGVVKLFINQLTGCNKSFRDLPDRNDRTALHWAAEKGRVLIVSYLLSQPKSEHRLPVPSFVESAESEIHDTDQQTGVTLRDESREPRPPATSDVEVPKHPTNLRTRGKSEKRLSKRFLSESKASLNSLRRNGPLKTSQSLGQRFKGDIEAVGQEGLTQMPEGSSHTIGEPSFSSPAEIKKVPQADAEIRKGEPSKSVAHIKSDEQLDPPIHSNSRKADVPETFSEAATFPFDHPNLKTNEETPATQEPPDQPINAVHCRSIEEPPTSSAESDYVNKQNEEGLTALDLSASEGHYDVVLELLKHGADPTIEGNDGLTALDRALFSGHAELVKKVLEYTTKMRMV